MYRKKGIQEQCQDFYYAMVEKVTKQEEEQYIYESVKRNFYSFRILITFIMLSQIYNIIRVLFYSKSGLGTVNNRIYFTLYIIMVITCVLGILFENKFKENMKGLERLYILTAFIWLLWHVGVNYYDLSKDAASGVDTYLVAVFTCAIFLQSKPIYCFMINALAYAIFSILTYRFLDIWDILNLFIAVMLSVIISVRMYMFLVNEIKQENDVLEVNELLEEERFELKMALRKYDIIMEYTNDIVFEWDIKQDILQFSNNVQEILPVPLVVRGARKWLEKAEYIHEDDKEVFVERMSMLDEKRRADEIVINIKNISGEYSKYYLRIFLQCGLSGEALCALGTLVEVVSGERKDGKSVKNEKMV